MSYLNNTIKPVYNGQPRE